MKQLAVAFLLVGCGQPDPEVQIVHVPVVITPKPAPNPTELTDLIARFATELNVPTPGFEVVLSDLPGVVGGTCWQQITNGHHEALGVAIDSNAWATSAHVREYMVLHEIFGHCTFGLQDRYGSATVDGVMHGFWNHISETEWPAIRERFVTTYRRL
jgi:hypothetical protein